MKKPILINDFLNAIDPDCHIDRKQALNDILLITVLMAFKKAKTLLSAEDQLKADKFLSNPNENFLKNVYAIFESAGKLTDLVEISEKVAEEVRKDYIKTQLKALNETDRNKIFEKFPELKGII